MIDQNIVVICEGNAEKAIIDVLLDNNMLIFSREELFKGGKNLRSRDFREFQRKNLEGIKVSKKLIIYRVQDDIPKKMTGHEVVPKKQYQHMIEDVIFVITRPEIEMLMIIYNNLEEEFSKYVDKSKSTPKASSFLRKYSKDFSDCKNYDFVYEHFSGDINKLITSLARYVTLEKHKKVLRTDSRFKAIFDLVNPDKLN